ncbi:MAG: chromosome partitioning protein [Actinomycetota bacterium]|nr:chromosome partitioning protein [Actinomycetota bacterium]
MAAPSNDGTPRPLVVDVRGGGKEGGPSSDAPEGVPTGLLAAKWNLGGRPIEKSEEEGPVAGGRGTAGPDAEASVSGSKAPGTKEGGTPPRSDPRGVSRETSLIGSVVSRETDLLRSPSLYKEDASVGQRPDPDRPEAGPRTALEAQVGWRSWRDVNAHATRTAVDAFAFDPLQLARRLLGGEDGGEPTVAAQGASPADPVPERQPVTKPVSGTPRVAGTREVPRGESGAPETRRHEAGLMTSHPGPTPPPLPSASVVRPPSLPEWFGERPEPVMADVAPPAATERGFLTDGTSPVAGETRPRKLPPATVAIPMGVVAETLAEVPAEGDLSGPQVGRERETVLGTDRQHGTDRSNGGEGGTTTPGEASNRDTVAPAAGTTIEMDDHRAVSRETDVSRETATGDVTASEERWSAERATSTPRTRQTSADDRESAMDGSSDMHDPSDTTAWTAARSAAEGSQPAPHPAGTMTAEDWSSTRSVTPIPPSPYENEEQRRTLVGSLPSVDESTPLAFEVAENARRRISLVGRPFPAPPHTRILTVANQKGGVGKTTTTVNVAAAMAQAGLNVLVLDIDPQGNASTALGIDHHADIPSLYDVVVEDAPLADVIQQCPDVPNLWCAPATIDLAGAEIELVSMVAREMRLQKSLDSYLDERYANALPQIDYIFIDCPPSLSLLTINAFVAATEVFIPIQCEYYALEGLSQLLKHIELIRGHLNPRLHVSTILLTMYDGRTRLSSQVAEEVRTHFSEVVVKTSVPRSVRISEAPSHSQTVMTYDPGSSGALSYLEAAREVAEQVLRWAPPAEQEERE